MNIAILDPSDFYHSADNVELCYLFGPHVQLFGDQLGELGAAEREEIDDLVNPAQELVSPEVSLQDTRKGFRGEP